MAEMILISAAFLLALVCLVFSVRQRREVYLPLPKGLTAALKSRRAVYLFMLAALAACAAVSLAEALAPLALTAASAPAHPSRSR